MKAMFKKKYGVPRMSKSAVGTVKKKKKISRRNKYVRGKNKASFNQLPSKMYSKRKLAVKNETTQEDINRKLRLFPCRKH